MQDLLQDVVMVVLHSNNIFRAGSGTDYWAQTSMKALMSERYGFAMLGSLDSMAVKGYRS
jgi:hypothetical protein